MGSKARELRIIRAVIELVPKRRNPIPEHIWQPRAQELACALCAREGMTLTEHHLIPKAVHRKGRFQRMYAREDMLSRKLLVCRPCHSAIHRCIPDEKELARDYATREALLGNACLAKQVAFFGKLGM